MGGVFHIAHPAAFDHDARCGGSVFCARHQLDARDRRNRRQRFTTKTQRADGSQIFSLADFRSRVTLEREHRIVAHHAFAVVGDLQKAPAAAFHIDCDARRAGIDRVFDQLFGDRSRAFDDFAGGN